MMHIQKQAAPPFGSFADINIESLGVAGMKLKLGYSHPAQLSFTVTVASHTLPFVLTDFIRVWDDAGAVDGTSEDQSGDNPLFEGFVEEITPGDEANIVKIVAYDPTYRSVRKCPLMNDEWDLDSGDEPVEGVAAYPRVVFNATQDNDDDYAYSIGQNHKLGQMIARVLTDGYLPLYHINAAPGDGSPEGNDQAWLEAELGSLTSGLSSSSGAGSGWAGGLQFEPQEKIVSQSESIRSFCERLLGQYDPTTKMAWQPGERLWRFVRVKQSPAVTITVNDPDAWHGAVLSMEIHRSAEGRYGAVKFYGPEGLEWRTAEWTAGSTADTLEPVDPVLVGISPNTGLCYHEWIITDTGFTRGANKGPYTIYVPGAYAVWANSNASIVTELVESYVQTWFASLQVRFPDSAAGNDHWKAVSGWRWDTRSGRIWLGDGCLYRWKPDDPSNKFEEPIGIRFIYPAFTEPLTVRAPDTGFAGTAFTVGGLEAEKKEYDEALAVGYSYGIPVTTPRRLSRFEDLADQILEQVKDLVYAGGIVLEGLQYDFARLNRRVNIAAKNDDGAPLVTGWESVGAIVTDVEYDFGEMTTTVQFSSDQLETIGLSPELLKQRLRIRPAQLFYFFSWNVAYTYSRKYIPGFGSFIGQDYGITVSVEGQWLDEFGEQQ